MRLCGAANGTLRMRAHKGTVEMWRVIDTGGRRCGLIQTPPCVACGAPSHTDVRLVPDDTDLPRLAFCQEHEQTVVDFLRALVRPEHIPMPPPPRDMTEATYYYQVVYRDKDGN